MSKQNSNNIPRKRKPSKRPSRGQSSSASNAMTTPIYRPIHKFHRVVESGYDIVTDGINPSLSGFVFALSSLPSFTDFTNLFDLYRIVKIDIDWVPEYTELTDAALVSNAVNVRFNSSIDLQDGTAPLAVNNILEYETLQSTPITKPHRRSFRPTILMGGVFPCNCWVPTASPNERHYAVKVAIPPTGVAMTFRARIKFWIECANTN